MYMYRYDFAMAGTIISVITDLLCLWDIKQEKKT